MTDQIINNIVYSDTIDFEAMHASWEYVEDALGKDFFWINYFPTNKNKFKLFSSARQVVIAGKNGWMFQDSAWLKFATWFAGTSFIPGTLRVMPRKLPNNLFTHVEHINKPILNILTDFHRTYGHTLMESVSRLSLAFELGIVSECDFILAPPAIAQHIKYFRDDLASAIADKMYYAKRKTLYVSNMKTFYTNHPSCMMNITGQQIELITKAFRNLEPKSKRFEKIFIIRDAKKRNISNLEQVVACVNHHGFEALAPKDIEATYIYFRHAKRVLGFHGSDLADSLFMQPGAALLELLPSDHRKPYYHNIAAECGVDYSCLLVNSEKQRHKIHGPSPFDVEIDINRLDEYLEQGESAAST